MLWISILALIFAIVNVIFGIFPAIPQVPTSFSNAVSQFFDLVFSNSGLVAFFLPMQLVKIALPIVLVLINFKYIYHIIMWIIRKIPLSLD